MWACADLLIAAVIRITFTVVMYKSATLYHARNIRDHMHIRITLVLPQGRSELAQVQTCSPMPLDPEGGSGAAPRCEDPMRCRGGPWCEA